MSDQKTATTNNNRLSFDTVKLAEYLATHIKGFAGPISAEKFTGGQSNPTYLINAASGKYVLRRKPDGELLKSAHAVDREYRVITALKDTQVPVAASYHLCENDSIVGSMFYLMEYIDGRVFWDPALPNMSKVQRQTIYTELNSVLAALHSVDINTAGLSDYGRPGNYFERQISRWSRQYKNSETETILAMDELINWLPKHMPVDDGKVTLVHGDFRLDNVMFEREEENAKALVDWELSTLGHPYSDIAYQCMQLRMDHAGVMPGLGGIDREALGIPSEEEYVSMYCKNMGIEKIPDWNFYIVFSFFRFAAILQGVKKRALDGNASSDEASKMGDMVKPLANMAKELIQ